MARRPAPSTPAQLPLDLKLEPRYGAEDFLVGPSNEGAFEFIMLWPEWPERLALISGPEGSGKSHLAHIWAARAGATILPALRLKDKAPARFAEAPALVLEDCDGPQLEEAQLFHLINLVRERGISLLMTARRAPEAWGVATADLLSRLRLAPQVTIATPDDALLRALLVKLFLDRQITVDLTVIEYLLPRIERSFAGVAGIVAALDAEALALGRRITRPVAAAVLERLSDQPAAE